MTDYKNELYPGIDKVFEDYQLGNATLLTNEGVRAAKEAIEALLSQHSKKRELEARKSEVEKMFEALPLTRNNELLRSSGEVLDIIEQQYTDRLNKLTNGEGRDNG